MKVTSISRKAFERLEKMKLTRNIRNTEGVIYDFTPKGNPQPKVFKNCIIKMVQFLVINYLQSKC